MVTRLAKRVAKLEQTEAAAQGQCCIAVRFVGPGSENYPQPTKEKIERAMATIEVVFVNPCVSNGG